MVKSDYSTALHEAGHAVVGLVRDLDVTFLTIIEDPDDDAAGATLATNNRHASEISNDTDPSLGLTDEELDEGFHWLEGKVLMLLAGAATTQVVTGELSLDGAGDDMERIRERVVNAYAPMELAEPPFLLDPDTDEVDQCWERWGDECLDILKQNWAWVEAVAKAAMDGDGTLTGDQMKALRPQAD